jgi:hypothetical protein
VRFRRIRFHAKARSREVDTLIYFSLALFVAEYSIASLPPPLRPRALAPAR